MDIKDIQGDSEDKKLIAEWDDILWDECFHEYFPNSF